MNIIVDFVLPLVAGICLLAAFAHLLIWLYRRCDWVHALFALVSLAAFLYVLNQRSLYQANTVDAWNAAHWRTSVILVLFYTAFPWFAASYSKVRARRTVLALNAPFVGLFLFAIPHPSGMFYSTVSNVGTRLLPWGEHVAVVVGARMSPAYFVQTLAAISVYAFALYLCRRQWRRGERVESLMLTMRVVLMGLGLVVDTLRDSGLVPLYAGEFCFVAFVITMSVSLARRLRRQAEAQERLNARLQQEIVERQQTEGVIRQLVKVSSGKFGRSFFESMAIELARILVADYACIGELHSTESDRIRTVAAVAEGKLVADFEYDLAHTPCENVLGKRVCSYPSNVAEEFPEDPLLSEWGVQGYVGVPLFGSDGSALGIMVALYHDPLANADFAELILQVFSTRVGSELERMRAEEMLRRSEEKYRRLVENAPEIIYRVHLKPELGFDYVSPSVTDVVGYTPEEHYADPTLGRRIVHPRDHDQLGAMATTDANEPMTKTIRWIRKDGTTIWTEHRIIPIRDDAGDLVALEGIASDVTERKRAEDAIREQLEELRRWHEVTLNREDRVQELKAEVNALLARLGEPGRYADPEMADREVQTETGD